MPPAQNSLHSGPVNAFDLAFGSVIVDEDTSITRVGEYALDKGLTLGVSNSKSFSRVTVTSTKPAFSIDVDIVSPPWKEVGERLERARGAGSESLADWLAGLID